MTAEQAIARLLGGGGGWKTVGGYNRVIHVAHRFEEVNQRQPILNTVDGVRFPDTCTMNYTQSLYRSCFTLPVARQ